MKSKYIVFVVVAIAVLVGLFVLLRPKDSTQPSTSATKSFVLVVKGKRLAEGPQTLTVKKGDVVAIAITSDEEEELHLHGYDKSVDLEPNKQATLRFTADKTGNFPYELEHSKTDIGSLQVQP
ncbi:MAG TPA: hypothetical protein VLE73_04225 [Candidatus Saccharimonadales bacterium]|nr:hypothetical protein [Candidatus Saccharimonadales bacterium]